MAKAFIIEKRDNVATLVEDADAGFISIIGDSSSESLIECKESIPEGYKIALSDIGQGEPIIKYGAQIGTAIVNIAKGHAVHNHNVISAISNNVKKTDYNVPFEYEVY